MVAVAVCAEVDRWQGFDALTASNPNCSVAPETWTTRDADGKVLKVEHAFRVTVKWDAVESDGATVHHSFWWSAEPSRKKAFLECADWLDEAEARIAKAQERR
jgi:hypothetical protein